RLLREAAPLKLPYRRVGPARSAPALRLLREAAPLKLGLGHHGGLERDPSPPPSGGGPIEAEPRRSAHVSAVPLRLLREAAPLKPRDPPGAAPDPRLSASFGRRPH